MWNETVTDRRNAPRSRPGGMMVLRTRWLAVRGRIADLSRSGAKLRVESLVGFEELVGRKVGIELHFDGHGTRWLYLRGCVLRVSPTFLTIVVAFENVPADFAEVVDREHRGAIVH